jgi:hypothetical protein
MSPDDIDTVVLKLYEFMIGNLGCELDEDSDDYERLQNFMHEALEPYVTRERNFN